MTGSLEGCKVVVVGGSSGMGKGITAGAVAGAGSAVIIGRNEARVDETVAELGKQGTAWGITADLADRAQVEAVREQFASGHADATLLVDAAVFFIPKPFLGCDGVFYDPSSARIHPSHFWRIDEHSDRR
jgi:NAD(P)-dependent dehydrogenase (short-subunit alcohol dehydrogenase family)